MMTDPIADMLTRIRNAYMAHKAEVELPYSKIKQAIADILVSSGYLSKAEKNSEKLLSLKLTLKYTGGQPAARVMQRVSRPGARRYASYDELKPVLNGYGLSILSTPRGVLTDKEARAAKVGGEILCEIY